MLHVINRPEVGEINGLANSEEYHKQVTYNIKRRVYWTQKGLKIIRLRLLSDVGFPVWDISYCTGVLPTGEYVDVSLPFDQLPKKNWKKFLIEQGKKEKLYLKGMGFFNFGVISTLC